jgi:hypothetical protein
VSAHADEHTHPVVCATRVKRGENLIESALSDVTAMPMCAPTVRLIASLGPRVSPAMLVLGAALCCDVGGQFVECHRPSCRTGGAFGDSYVG